MLVLYIPLVPESRKSHNWFLSSRNTLTTTFSVSSDLSWCQLRDRRTRVPHILSITMRRHSSLLDDLVYSWSGLKLTTFQTKNDFVLLMRLLKEATDAWIGCQMDLWYSNRLLFPDTWHWFAKFWFTFILF